MTCSHGMPSPASCADCIYDEGLGAAAEPVTATGIVFEARYDGTCSGCGGDTYRGQPIAKMSDDSYRHKECSR